MLCQTIKGMLTLTVVMALVVTSAMGEPRFRAAFLPELFGNGSIAAGVSSDTTETRVYGCSFDEDADTYRPVEWILYPEIEFEVNPLPFIYEAWKSMARMGLDSWDPYLPGPVRLIYGYSTEPSGARRATLWKDDGQDVSLVLLPMLEGYLESDALGGWGRADPSFTTSYVSGWARDPQGFRKATVWEINNSILWDPQGLPDLGPGTESVARNVIVAQIDGSGAEVAFCYGSVFDEEGRELPAVWQNAGAGWTLDVPEMPEPYEQGGITAHVPGSSGSPLCDPPEFIPDLIAWYNWVDMEGNLIWCMAVYRWNSDTGRHEFHHILPDTCTERPVLRPLDLDIPRQQAPVIVGEYCHDLDVPTATIWELADSETTNIYDLNDLVVNALPWPLRSARGIDDTGQIVGIARETAPGENIAHAFIAIPMSSAGVETGELPSAPDPFQLRSTCNPFFERTSISYRVEESAPVLLSVHDMSGRQVAQLANGWHEAGRYEVNWDGRSQQGERLPGGVYALRVQAGMLEESGKVVIFR
ncbi:FlgD immunoglobulin-like domain containing protein [Candidatus Eisenbacteria bacterium]|uniref:FlgD immunoglobulin-like domain containing protein n=1 Tax=Eiseniibacteriota bacterium TaxID=2212470 RepID=A0ABV6YKB9_UNCEI